jgi:hypothetical protein
MKGKPQRVTQSNATMEHAAASTRRNNFLYGKMGAASPCRRICPRTGKVLEEIPARYDRSTTQHRHKR